jgi:hypothetical protein
MVDRITCPACGREQDSATDCRKCGIVFARYGEARSLFTARRTPTRGPRSPRAALVDLHPGWRTVLLAMAFGLVGGYAIWFDVEPAPTPVSATTSVLVAPGGPTDPVAAPDAEEAPGLTADQLRWGLVDTWRAPAEEAAAAEPPAVEDQAVAPTEPQRSPPAEPEVEPEPEPRARPAVPPRGASRETTLGSSLRTPRGETSAPYAARGGGSPNRRFDPVGSRGWYEGIDGYERALDERDRNTQTLVVYFHAPWCSWCARFRKEYLSHRDMKAFLSDVVRVHIDPENSEAEAELATLFGVRAFPSFYVVPAGTERPERLHPFLGDVELTPRDFASRAAYVARGVVFPYDQVQVLSFDGLRPFDYDMRSRRRRRGRR